ncbi:VanZ family protein [Thermotomaculum hydrothermale]|uniref:VanZ family protein n=1 Tax=Thermotomaculum hydrothermale TaxID=981385 RepID=A0A7R6PPH8_9BACT|nr:VanZ family protein [Thermotomaculum hydrothermale]
MFLHCIEYSGLTVLAYYSYLFKDIPSILLFVELFAFSDEFHQFFVPGRTFSFLDFLADFIGAILCLIVIIKYKEKIYGERN